MSRPSSVAPLDSIFPPKYYLIRDQQIQTLENNNFLRKKKRTDLGPTTINSPFISLQTPTTIGETADDRCAQPSKGDPVVSEQPITKALPCANERERERDKESSNREEIKRSKDRGDELRF